MWSFIIGLAVGYALCLGCFWIYEKYPEKIEAYTSIPLLIYNSFKNNIQKDILKGGNKVENGNA